MSIEQNKAMCRKLNEEVFNNGNVDLIDDLLSPDFVDHGELPPGVANHREALKLMVTMTADAIEDSKMELKDLVAEGDKVAMYQIWSGTHIGEFMGIPATNKSFSVDVFNFVRFENGKMVEHWENVDMMGMMQQLGLMPDPA